MRAKRRSYVCLWLMSVMYFHASPNHSPESLPALTTQCRSDAARYGDKEGELEEWMGIGIERIPRHAGPFPPQSFPRPQVQYSTEQGKGGDRHSGSLRTDFSQWREAARERLAVSACLFWDSFPCHDLIGYLPFAIGLQLPFLQRTTSLGQLPLFSISFLVPRAWGA